MLAVRKPIVGRLRRSTNLPAFIGLRDPLLDARRRERLFKQRLEMRDAVAGGAVTGKIPWLTWAQQWQVVKQLGAPSAVSCSDLLGSASCFPGTQCLYIA
jgi:hypothetical protein